MMSATDIADEDGPVWDENYSPPPWVAEVDEDAASDACEPWRVVCYGYEDETPIVCTGSPNWPLWREQALILAASLDLLKVARVMLDYSRSGAGFSYPLGSVLMLEEAIAKAEGRRPNTSRPA